MLDLQVLLDAICIMSTACETEDFHCLFLAFHYLPQGDSNPKAECSYNLIKDHLGPVDCHIFIYVLAQLTVIYEMHCGETLRLACASVQCN